MRAKNFHRGNLPAMAANSRGVSELNELVERLDGLILRMASAAAGDTLVSNSYVGRARFVFELELRYGFSILATGLFHKSKPLTNFKALDLSAEP